MEKNVQFPEVRSKVGDFGYKEGDPGLMRSLEEFDPENPEIPDDFFMVLSGKRRTGKSWFLRWFLSKPRWRKRFDFVYVVSNTAFNGFWQPIVGEEFVFQGWEGNLIEGQESYGKVLTQKLIEKQVGEFQAFEGPAEEAKKHVSITLLILDDVISEKGFHEEEVIKQLAVMGRHFNMAVAITTQHPTGIATWLRTNVDVAVVFQQRTKLAQDNTFDDFMGVMKDKHVASAYLDKYTKDHGCIVYINASDSHDPFKLLFKLNKTEEEMIPGKFELGGPKQKEINRKARKEGRHGNYKGSGKRSRGSSSGDFSGDDGGLIRRDTPPGKLYRQYMAAPGEV